MAKPNTSKSFSVYSDTSEIITLSKEVGELTGVVKGMSKQLDDLSEHILTKDKCTLIVNDAFKSHEKEYHKKLLSNKIKAVIAGASTLVAGIITLLVKLL